jgi:hypothetical protein
MSGAAAKSLALRDNPRGFNEKSKRFHAFLSAGWQEPRKVSRLARIERKRVRSCDTAAYWGCPLSKAWAAWRLFIEGNN